MAVGCDLLELDVQLSADGRVVVCHDSDDLARLCGPPPLPGPPGTSGSGPGSAAGPRRAGPGRRGKVADYAVADLPLLLRHPPEAAGTAAAAAGAGPTAAGPTAAGSDPDATRMPLLEEVLREFPGMPLQVDIKVASPRLVAAVAELLARYRPLAAGAAPDAGSGGAKGQQQQQSAPAHAPSQTGQTGSPTSPAPFMQAAAVASASPSPSPSPSPSRASCSSYAGSGVLWGSFHHATCCQMHATDPARPLFCSAPRALLLLAAHLSGRLDEVTIFESAIILPWRPRATTWVGRVVVGLMGLATGAEAAKHAGAASGGGGTGGGGGASLLLPDFFRALQARGVSVILFGDVNTESDFEACLGAGADALCTDSPARLRAWLRGKGKQQQS
ncbi:hypothetical protein HXX76_009918 [Chlamydomonas incerta]|uniref:glycerophosphodiester phosphodiesterase n=1 Tax=Chlamydomonas incerta TaxID=51695 RepID=A0A835T1X6_CHLIN|nr:hypothetical protein HXX76_009918 [Chlamydomonas incerta]|eukprot:KAG2430950.1 hypothetical protein HXX76_009918 [Chlamydomonas incerta]